MTTQLEVKKYGRKTFYVDAVQVTQENIKEVAEWCSGTIALSEESGESQPYVRVRVHRPLTERQTKAFIGDYVLYAGTGYKVYTPAAFEKSFEEVRGSLSKKQADAAGIKPLREVDGKPATTFRNTDTGDEIDFNAQDLQAHHDRAMAAKPKPPPKRDYSSVEDDVDEAEQIFAELDAQEQYKA